MPVSVISPRPAAKQPESALMYGDVYDMTYDICKLGGDLCSMVNDLFQMMHQVQQASRVHKERGVDLANADITNPSEVTETTNY